MSDAEQELAMGRTLSEYVATKRRLAALWSETERIAQEYQRLMWYLNPSDSHTAGLRNGAAVPEIPELPTREQLGKLIADALEALKQRNNLRERLRQYGAEPKD